MKSEENFLLFKNELKNKIVSKYKLIGISSELILSFNIFPKNDDIKIFIESTFNLDFKPYVYKTRTLITAKVVREIYKSDSMSLTQFKNNLYKFIEDTISNDK